MLDWQYISCYGLLQYFPTKETVAEKLSGAVTSAKERAGAYASRGLSYLTGAKNYISSFITTPGSGKQIFHKLKKYRVKESVLVLGNQYKIYTVNRFLFLTRRFNNYSKRHAPSHLEGRCYLFKIPDRRKHFLILNLKVMNFSV